ncbi:uncharacterized protein LOC134832607 [Culicoides brevitarsis]|uniref:uncharacterized protein LOC134832607 n=1 Tax=Culicoides brevitarsis TaxID=469753 RepID=UPI00307CA7F7
MADSCRCCMSAVTEFTSHYINLIGFSSLTYKEMFELAVGYEIFPSESQQFCDSCARQLVDWYEFKAMCDKTQERLLPASTRTAPETLWLASHDDEAPVQIKTEVKVEPDVEYLQYLDESVSSSPPPAKKKKRSVSVTSEIEDNFVTVHFRILIRNFGLQLTHKQKEAEKPEIGLVTVEGSNETDLMHQVWLCVKPLLKREIIFDEERCEARWHQNSEPLEEDMSNFVLFQDNLTKYTYVSPNFDRFKIWHKQEKNLYVYPYSKNLHTILQFKIAMATLVDRDPKRLATLTEKLMRERKMKEIIKSKPSTETLPTLESVTIPAKTTKSNEKSVLTVTFATFIRYFKMQGVSGTPASNFTISGKNLEEFKHNVWKAIKPHLVGEIIFDDHEPPKLSENAPTEDDMNEFVHFHNKTTKQGFVVDKLTEYLLKSWKDKDIVMYIYPYSMSVANRNLWQEASKIITEPAKIDEDRQLCENVLEKLKENHFSQYGRDATDAHWRMWAKYVSSYPTSQHEKLMQEEPPVQFLTFFDKNFSFVSPDEEKTPEDTKFKVKFFGRLKISRSDMKKQIFIGELEIAANSPEEFCNKVWDRVQPFIVREVTFVDSFPKLGDGRPSQEDLHKFVILTDAERKQNFKIGTFEGKNCVNEATLERWTKSCDVFLDILPFSTSIDSVQRKNLLDKILLDQDSESARSTEKLISQLKSVHGTKFIAFDYFWRLWAHFIQGSQQESLVHESPPQELQHLFTEMSVHENFNDMLDAKRGSTEPRSPKDVKPSIYEKLNLSKADLADKTKLKHCVFEGCTSIVQISSFVEHLKRCKFNPDLELIYHCTFEPCQKIYPKYSTLKTHLNRCRYNPDRERKIPKQCPHCPQMVTNMKNHIAARHSDEQRYICDTCGVAKATRQMLQDHVKAIHLGVTYTCKICDSVFKSRFSLKGHTMRVHSDKPLELKKCELCAYVSYSDKLMAKHLRSKHDPNNQKVPCPICEKLYINQKALEVHMQVHADTEFPCDVCSHVSKTERGLKSHQTLHQEWKYECPACGLKRRSAFEVRVHCKKEHPGYVLPPKGTVLKKTSRNRGQMLSWKWTENERQENSEGERSYDRNYE